MENQLLPQSDDPDEILSVLADRNRRTVLNYLSEVSTGTVSLDELARAVDERGPGGADEPRVVLHHSVLPMLEAVRVADYDPDRGVVHHPGHDLLETRFEAIGDADSRED